MHLHAIAGARQFSSVALKLVICWFCLFGTSNDKQKQKQKNPLFYYAPVICFVFNSVVFHYRLRASMLWINKRKHFIVYCRAASGISQLFSSRILLLFSACQALRPSIQRTCNKILFSISPSPPLILLYNCMIQFFCLCAVCAVCVLCVWVWPIRCACQIAATLMLNKQEVHSAVALALMAIVLTGCCSNCWALFVWKLNKMIVQSFTYYLFSFWPTIAAGWAIGNLSMRTGFAQLAVAFNKNFGLFGQENPIGFHTNEHI